MLLLLALFGLSADTRTEKRCFIDLFIYKRWNIRQGNIVCSFREGEELLNINSLVTF